MKSFYVGGPNQRKDYHIEEGEEVGLLTKTLALELTLISLYFILNKLEADNKPNYLIIAFVSLVCFITY